MQPQQRKHIGPSPPSGEDTPDRRQVQRKEKEGGTSAKGSVLRLTCVPLPHLVVPLSGCACSGTPTRQHEVRQGDTHGSDFAAIRGVPLSNQQRKICDGPGNVKALRLGRRSMSSWITGVSRHAVSTLRLRRPITATTQIHQEVQPTRTFIVPSLPNSLG